MLVRNFKTWKKSELILPKVACGLSSTLPPLFALAMMPYVKL